VFSWLPARITAALLAVPGAWQRLRHLPGQAGLTASPNGGWPMAAMALTLNVRLAKPGVYTLHPAGRSPTLDDTARALRFSARVVGGLAALACVTALFIGWRHYS
jgi:adenosylcobinamide-phosphate synthase